MRDGAPSSPPSLRARQAVPVPGAVCARAIAQTALLLELRHKALPNICLSTVRYGRAVGVAVLAERGRCSVSKVSAGSVTVGNGARAVPHRTATTA